MRILSRIFALAVLGGGLAVAALGAFALQDAKTGDNQVFAAIMIAIGAVLFIGGCLMFLIFGLGASLERMIHNQRRMVLQQSASLQAQLAAAVPTPRESSLTAATFTSESEEDSTEVESPEPVTERYFYGDPEGHERGPLDLAAIRALVQVETIDDDTPIYKTPSRVWGTIADFPELAV